MNVFDRGVKLPTNGLWVDIPDSPFQVRADMTDTVGTFHIRVRPSYSAFWEEFMSDKEAGLEDGL